MTRKAAERRLALIETVKDGCANAHEILPADEALPATLSALAFVLLFGRWAYDRRRGHNPLAKELAALQKMRAQNQ